MLTDVGLIIDSVHVLIPGCSLCYLSYEHEKCITYFELDLLCMAEVTERVIFVCEDIQDNQLRVVDPSFVAACQQYTIG